MFLTILAESPFSLQALPYGVFRPGVDEPARVCVAIGEWVLDMAALEAGGLLGSPTWPVQGVFSRSSLNVFMSLGRPAWDETRAVLQALLGPLTDGRLSLPSRLTDALHPMDSVELLMPVEIGDYTDFYSSREHATNVGTMFRGAEAALLPNWLHLPVAYHGRASTVTVSGEAVIRPQGQSLPTGATAPIFGPTAELDFELEVGFFVGPGNRRGEAIPVQEAAEHIFGLVLVNDWSARDIQRWEYRPLGPFLSKSFATSISPWVIPLAALEPFRCPGPKQEPAPLPYLWEDGDRAFDIHLEATLSSEAMRLAGIPPVAISRTNFRHLYWSMNQQLAHHTANGCAMRPGDLLASGTISGPAPDSFGSLLELTWGGSRPLELPTGETRRFLEDGDRLAITGWCEGAGFRVGLGEVAATIIPANT